MGTTASNTAPPLSHESRDCGLRRLEDFGKCKGDLILGWSVRTASKSKRLSCLDSKSVPIQPQTEVLVLALGLEWSGGIYRVVQK